MKTVMLYKNAFKQDLAAFVHTMGLHRWQQAQSRAYYS
jgi:hypothetical protein